MESSSTKYLGHFVGLIKWGLAYSIVVIVGVGIYAMAGGPIPHQTNWVGLAEAILVFGLMLLGLAASAGREPNPYTRTDPLYNLRDVPPQHQTLDSGSADMHWNLLPIVVAIAALAKFVVLH